MSGPWSARRDALDSSSLFKSRGLNREQHLAYRAAPWNTPEESEAFLATVQTISVDDVLALLKVLTDKSLSADAVTHRRRCAVFGRLVAEVRERELFPHYLAALKFPERLVRAAVAPLLPQVTAVTDHPAICELLRSRDDELRAHSARILKQIGGKTALGLVAAMIGER